MEQLGERLNATRRALDTLAEALQMPFSDERSVGPPPVSPHGALTIAVLLCAFVPRAMSDPPSAFTFEESGIQGPVGTDRVEFQSALSDEFIECPGLMLWAGHIVEVYECASLDPGT